MKSYNGIYIFVQLYQGILKQAMKPKSIKSYLVSTMSLMLLLSGLSCVTSSCTQEKVKEEYVPFTKQHLEFKTEPTFKGSAPQPFDNRVPAGAIPVVYQSEKQDMKGWLFTPVVKEGKRPAVLYAHSGFALDKYDAEAVRPLVDAGYVVFLPSWRAENGNPGHYEQCCGEVVDAVNALNWLSNRPEVDSSEIYGAGNGVGATIIWLLAEMSPKMKKVAAFGPNPSMLRTKKTYSEPPFNLQIPMELKIRSPGEYFRDLKCPLMLLYVSGDNEDEAYMAQAKEIYDEVRADVKKPVEFTELVGADHKTRTDSAMTRMVTFFSSQ